MSCIGYSPSSSSSTATSEPATSYSQTHFGTSTASSTKTGTISSPSIFGTPLNQECAPIPVLTRREESAELRTWRITRQGLVQVDAATMGAFLDKPKTAKTNLSGEGNGLRYAMSSMQGWRVDMEDAHVTEAVMSDEAPYKDWAFFAVFDGHAGSATAKQASRVILKHLIDTSEFKQMTQLLEQSGGTLTPQCLSLLESGIKLGFLALDEFIKGCRDCSKSGSTAVCAIVTPTHVIIGNLGDSRAVIASGEEVFGTEDHKPYLDKERKRIEDAGGSVMIQRINGSLAVSRAFGDFEYKDHPMLPAKEQLVSPEPDVYIKKRDVEKDEFMVVACDGVYDVMENDELANFVRGRLTVHSDLREVCDEVLDACLSKGSRDNMTMVVVCFPSAPAIDPEKQEEESKWIAEMRRAIEEIVSETVKSEEYNTEDEVNIEWLQRQVELSSKAPTAHEGPAHMTRTLIDQILTCRGIKHS